MIRLKLGIPASGKTQTSMNEVAREVRSGGRVLWLTPLKSEVKRVAEEFVRIYGVPIEKIYPIPSKLDVCPVIRNMKDIYHIILGIATCLACKHKTCVFKTFIQKAVNKDVEGLFIATHKFLWLGLFFKKMYIDEIDFLIPDMFELLPRKKVETLIRAIEKVFGTKIANRLKKKFLVEIDDKTFVFKGIYPFRYFYNHRDLIGISATLRYGSDIMAQLFGFDTMMDLAEAIDDGAIYFYLDVLPTPSKLDFFYILRFRNYWTSYWTKKWYIKLKNNVKQDIRHGYTVTVIARSKREAIILDSIFKREGLSPLVERINWTLRNYDGWKRNNLRIIITRGLFHRALNIESDKIYAFYQHLYPKEKQRQVGKLRPVWGDMAEEIVAFDEYRSHVQTIFRCARKRTSRHEFYLLDSKYDEALMYFDHIYDFTKKRTTYITSL